MKKLSQTTIYQRKTKILEAIIDYFWVQKKSVSSKNIKENYSLEFSGATIRKVMFDLQKEGYLKKSHKTSAYQPTSKGCRFILEKLIESSSSLVEQKKQILKTNNEVLKNFDIQFNEVSTKLKNILELAGLNVRSSDSTSINYVHFLKTDKDKIKIIVIGDSELPKVTVVKIAPEIDDILLNYLNNIINKSGNKCSAYEIKYRVLETIDELKHQTNMVISFLSTLVEQ